MVLNKKEEIFTKTAAVVALATLIFLALSFMIVPNQGDDSAFVIKLKADEPRIQYVDTTPGTFQEFEMELYSTNVDPYNHKIALQISDITYINSNAANWEFAFRTPDDIVGDSSIYHAGPDEVVDVGLKVTFQGTQGGEMVTFTISGIEDGQNDTRLSPVSSSSTSYEYLGVVSNTPYMSYTEPASGKDGEGIPLTDGGIFTIRIWNIGQEEDVFYIADWIIWLDDGDGVFSPAAGRAGEDIRNDHFDIKFTAAGGAAYEPNQNITLSSGDDEEIQGEVIPTQDNDLVPVGNYFIQTIVDSANGEPSSTLFIYPMGEVTLPDFEVLKLEVDNYDIEEGETVKMDATIGIDVDNAGEFAYAFYVDDELIEGSSGTRTFTANDNTKVVSYEWKAKTGDSDTRIIKVKIDPDDEIPERDETNNQRTTPIEVTEEEAKFPVWILALVVVGVVVAVGAYWSFTATPGGNVKIDDIIIRPDPPKAGDSAEIIAVIKNEGSDFEVGDKRSIVVSFYEDYESIGEKTIDLTADNFEGGSTREVNLAWEPAAAGLHNLNVAVDIDEEESDVSSKDIEIGE